MFVTYQHNLHATEPLKGCSMGVLLLHVSSMICILLNAEGLLSLDALEYELQALHTPECWRVALSQCS